MAIYIFDTSSNGYHTCILVSPGQQPLPSAGEFQTAALDAYKPPRRKASSSSLANHDFPSFTRHLFRPLPYLLFFPAHSPGPSGTSDTHSSALGTETPLPACGDQVARLACPDCARTDFPSVQGLLNHCRLRHARELGSHDECIEQCAVLVPPAECTDIVERGPSFLVSVFLACVGCLR